MISRRLPAFYRAAQRLLGNEHDAEDAVQEALLSAYKKQHQFRGESQMSTWLTAIVSNCARMQLRRRPRQKHLSLDEPISRDSEFLLKEQIAENRPSPEEEYQNLEITTVLRKLTPRLSPVLRKTFHLRHVEGLSLQQTAEILDIPVGTVKAHLSRARARLKPLLRRSFSPSGSTR